MGGLFQSETKTTPAPTTLETPWGSEMRSYLTNLMKTSQPQQYAGMTDTEKQGQSLLGTYLSSGTPEAYTLGMDQLRNTLTGGYDPNTSQYYQGLRSQMATQTSEDVADLRRRQQLGGMFSSGPAYRAEAGLLTDASNQANTLLGSLYESERQKQADAMNSALQYAQYGDTSALAKIGAANEYGSLERDIQNQQYAADYQNQLYQSQLAQLLMAYQPWYQQQYYQEPSMFSEILSGAGDLSKLFSSIWGTTTG